MRRGEWLWNELDSFGASVVQTGLLALGALSHGLIAWSTGWAMGTRLELPALGAVLCALHWALIAAFTYRLSGQPGAAMIAAAAIGWWIPSLALDPAASRWSWLFDPGRHLAVGNGPHPAWTASLVDSIPLVAWWVATALLPKRSVFRR